MIGYIVSGHGRFASGITAALELIMGKQEYYVPVDFPEGDTKTEIEANMHEALESLQECESIIVFCDLLSGSPFNTSIMEAMSRNNVEVVYGTNLGMLMESVLKRTMGMSAQEIADGAVATGKEGIGRFTAPDTEEEDDF